MRMNPLAEIAQHLTEQEFGTGVYKEGWHQGDDPLLPRRWTTIACSQCGNQVYFDKVMYRHRCCECGYGF